MKKPHNKNRLLISCTLTTIALWALSQWSEKGLAENLGHPAISPDGCYRIEAFKPFWVLPNIFHPQPHPDDDVKPTWFTEWRSPTFFRLLQNHSKTVISETKIYDISDTGTDIFWGGPEKRIAVGMVFLTLSAPPCDAIRNIQQQFR